MLSISQIRSTQQQLYEKLRICEHPDYLDKNNLRDCLELISRMQDEEKKTVASLNLAIKLRNNPDAYEHYESIDSVISELKGGAAYEN